MPIPDAAQSKTMTGAHARVLAATTLALCFSMNPVIASVTGFIFRPMAQEFGWNNTAVSAGITLCYSMTALCGLLIGRAVRRFGPRRVAPLLSCLFAMAVAAIGTLHPSYPLFLLLMFVIGVVGAGATPFAYASILPQWFDRRLGLALGVATAGIAVGQITAPMALHALVASYGWREAAMLFGAIAIVLIAPVTWFGYRERRGRHRPEAPTDTVGLTLAQAARTVTFWRMVLAFFFVSTVGAGTVFHLVPLMTSHGLSVHQSAQIIALSGAVLFFARLASGWLLDFVRPSTLSTISFLGSAAGALLLWQGTSVEVLAAGAALVLLGLGTEGDLIPYMVRQQFGLRAYATIYGAFGTVFGSGPLLGPMLVAMSKDYLGSYGPVLSLFAGACVAAAALLIGLRTPVSRLHQQPT